MNRHRKLRRLRPQVLHFFDTNFLILSASQLPALNNVPIESRWITETVREEAIERLGHTAWDSIAPRFRILVFRDLYERDRRVCPVFYWFILSMYNPATVGSASFGDDLFESMLIKKTITQEQRDAYEKFRRRSGRCAKAGSQPAFERLRHSATRLQKKARRSLQDRHPAYVRDIKSLSLALYHSLSSRQNVVYYTADGDTAILLLKWLDTMTMWMMMGKIVLSRLTGTIDMEVVRRGGRVSMVLDFDEFAREKLKLVKSMLSDGRKTDACRFTIRHWNQSEKRLDENVYLVFEDKVAGWLANIHGPMSCEGSANADLGNWIRFHYYWPPPEDQAGRLRVEVFRKAVVRSESLEISALDHDRRCHYRQDDFGGRIQDWSQFT